MQEYRLHQLFRVKHGFAFKSEFFSDEGLYAVTSPGHFHEKGGFRNREGKEKFYVGDFHADYLLRKGDLIIAMTEQGEGLLGSTAKIPTSNYYLHNQRLGLVNEVEHELIDETYLYFLLNTESVRKQIAASSSGTKVRHTSPGRIGKAKVDLPTLPIQKKIASILSAYDDLIENNTQRIGLLEEMAEEIYKEWFVRMRFPGHEQCRWYDKEGNEVERGTEGGLPEGWEICRIGKAFNTQGGSTPSTTEVEYWRDGTINWFSPTDITGSKGMFLEQSSNRITAAGLKNSSAKIFPAKSVMMTSRATIGAVGINLTEACTNQGFITCIPNAVFTYPYIYQWIRLNKQLLENFSGGATFKEISRTVFRNLKILKPSKAVADKYFNLVEPMLEEASLLQKKNQVLQETRDLLLPRLISGKLGVEGLADERPRMAMAAEPEMQYGK